MTSFRPLQLMRNVSKEREGPCCVGPRYTAGIESLVESTRHSGCEFCLTPGKGEQLLAFSRLSDTGGGFCNSFCFLGTQGLGKSQRCQLSTKSIHIIQYPLVCSSDPKMWLFSNVLSEASSVSSCILSSIASLVYIIVNTLRISHCLLE